jgi:serine/threonine-protein kinase
MSSDRERLSRFRSEVSIARQVSHPNVCRVYDIADADGLTFLSMEYIDGEDLGSLLRRIGRLPPDKGLGIARQICAGLAAAHDRGVVHRDLKPGNVMIDGRGHARIADFGLAFGVGPPSFSLLAKPVGPPGFSPVAHRIAGTPAYMAPEQFEGRPATIQSDIYALGLVLYEIFTGKRAFTASTVGEFAAFHRERTPSSMTALVTDLDPAIERAIGRCLAKDPAARPVSALSVAASLPGGDPLAAAIARGETPSPELVASAGSVGLVKPAYALAGLGTFVLCLIATVVLSGELNPARIVPLPKSPEVLRDRAQQAVAVLGYPQAPADYSSGFTGSGYLYYTQTEPWWQRRDDLRTGRPSGILFWYRQSPDTLEPYGYTTRVSEDDPPETVPGMIGVTLDPLGRLQRFLAVPPRAGEPSPGGRTPDWSVAFHEADLDLARFTPSPSRWRPQVFADARAAWDGKYPDRPDVPIHIEAAAVAGRIVYFETFNPWNQPADAGQAAPSTRRWFINAFMPVLLLGILLSAILLAVRNLRLGRGDRRGALRIACLLFGAMFMSSIVGADLDLQASTPLGLVISGSGQALLLAVLAWFAYVALEPYMRRRLPHVLISWTRLLSGRVRDPLVGRDVLVGVVIGVLVVLSSQVSQFVVSGEVRSLPPVWPLDGLRFALASVLNEVCRSVMGGLGILLLLFSLTLVVRRQSIAAMLFVLLVAANGAAGSDTPVPAALFSVLSGTALMFALWRFGLLALAGAVLAGNLVARLPLTFDPSQ